MSQSGKDRRKAWLPKKTCNKDEMKEEIAVHVENVPKPGPSIYELAARTAEGDQKSLEILEAKVAEGAEIDFSSQNWIHVDNLLEQAIAGEKLRSQGI